MASPHQHHRKTLLDRDIQVLLNIYQKVTLTTEQIHRLCFDRLSLSAAYKCVEKLKKIGVIDTAKYNLGSMGKFADILTLSRIGFQCLQDVGEVSDDEKFLTRKAPALLPALTHRLGIVDYWISLELSIKKQNRFQLALFVPEYVRLENGKTIAIQYGIKNNIPLKVRSDALFILLDSKHNLEYLYFLEVDRGSVPIKTSAKLNSALSHDLDLRSNINSKVKKLQLGLLRGNQTYTELGLRFSNFQGARVVIVTSSAKRLLNLINVLKFRSEFMHEAIFLFSYLGEANKGAFDCRYAIAVGTKINTVNLTGN